MGDETSKKESELAIGFTVICTSLTVSFRAGCFFGSYILTTFVFDSFLIPCYCILIIVEIPHYYYYLPMAFVLSFLTNLEILLFWFGFPLAVLATCVGLNSIKDEDSSLELPWLVVFLPLYLELLIYELFSSNIRLTSVSLEPFFSAFIGLTGVSKGNSPLGRSAFILYPETMLPFFGDMSDIIDEILFFSSALFGLSVFMLSWLLI